MQAPNPTYTNHDPLTSRAEFNNALAAVAAIELTSIGPNASDAKQKALRFTLNDPEPALDSILPQPSVLMLQSVNNFDDFDLSRR